jgi:hypothetical protein
LTLALKSARGSTQFLDAGCGVFCAASKVGLAAILTAEKLLPLA